MSRPVKPPVWCAAAVLASSLGVASLARAQHLEPALVGSADSAEARAEARFRAASEAFDRGRVDEACVGLAASMQLFPALGTLLNLALCHEKQGRTATAWREFSDAAAWAADHDRREFAHQHALRLERGLARVQIDVMPQTPSAAISLDGEPLSEARRALPVFVDPGEHTVTATASGSEPYAGKVVVPATVLAGPIVVHVPVLQQARIAAPPESPPAAPPSLRRTAGWITGGFGIVAVGVGAAFAVDGMGKTGDLSSCRTSCDPGGARGSEAVSLAAFGAGLAALAVGAWLVWSPAPDSVASGLRVGLAPRLTERGEGLMAYGSF